MKRLGYHRLRAIGMELGFLIVTVCIALFVKSNSSQCVPGSTAEHAAMCFAKSVLKGHQLYPPSVMKWQFLFVMDAMAAEA